MRDELVTISERLRDERGKRVLYVAHCLLNENARYQGGAFRPGGNDGIIDQAQRAGVGIVQMRCPEQRAWGGVRRPLMWILAGRRGSLLYRLRRPFLAIFIWYTRRVWRRIARDTVWEMRDFVRAGTEIVGVVGIGGSPSCGIERTLDLHKGAEYIAGVSPAQIEREAFNLQGIRNAVVPGQGHYIELLRREMRHHRIEAPFFEDDLVAQLEGCPKALQLGLAERGETKAR